MKFEVPNAVCPNCQRALTGASSAQSDPTPPRGGDLTVCIWCSAILAFTDDLRLAFLPPDVEPPEDIARVQRAVIKLLDAQDRGIVRLGPGDKVIAVVVKPKT